MRRAFALLLLFSASPSRADEVATCVAAIEKVRQMANTLPADDLSRRIAESELNTARVEMEAGEVEDCPDLVARAQQTVLRRPYRLLPGETLGFPPP